MNFLRWFGRIPLVVWALLAAGTLALGYRQALIHARQQQSLLELQLHTQVQINDSTAARLAATVANRDSLGGVIDAAKRENARLIAALRIHVPARDTVIQHDTLATTVVDSTRTASFRDSVFGGIVITGVITAPPCCAPLLLEYGVHRPAFNPQIGFAQLGGRTVAIVSWQGEEFQIEAPFADIPKPLRTLGAFAEGYYRTDGQVVVRAGPALRVHGWSLQAGGEWTGRIAGVLGIRKDW